MTKTSADFFYLASNVANSDRPEYAQHFRDAGHAIAALEKQIETLQRQDILKLEIKDLCTRWTDA